jgi:predicted membrane chloride channel (bestrophin family)
MLKKRLFWMTTLIGVMFVFTLSGCDFLNGEEDDPFTVKNADGWNNALDAIKKGVRTRSTPSP